MIRVTCVECPILAVVFSEAGCLEYSCRRQRSNHFPVWFLWLSRSDRTMLVSRFLHGPAWMFHVEHLASSQNPFFTRRVRVGPAGRIARPGPNSKRWRVNSRSRLDEKVHCCVGRGETQGSRVSEPT